ncbi:MAG: purine-nucleoside phosphorylase [Deltaproteobacteria bacterium]|nr:purine-nucleoside phosphorylase [Deltaproteobacteria bacterium]
MHYDDIQRAAEFLGQRITPRKPRVGLILGSGLGAFADSLDDAQGVPYDTIPGFAQSTVKGHAGRFVAGKSAGMDVLAMQGRVHLYEGLPLEQVVLPARAMVKLGCEVLVITNAAGGISEGMTPGELVLISDHLNLQGQNPLTGENDERLGTRFPDMTEAYAPALRELAQKVGASQGLSLRQGVYAGLLGPSYETPAEIRMLRAMGADLAGMSTVSEVIAVHHMGARALGISCVTNLAAGLGGKLTHDEVKATAEEVKPRFIKLLEGILAALREELA